jgi:hypothetical protein
VPRRRMIHDSIWRSETLAQLPRDARYLFIGLITTADDQGRRRGHPGLIRSDIFPLDDVSLDDIVDWLCMLEKMEAIKQYEAGGVLLVQIVKWWEYQGLTWAWPSSMPAPDGWEDRLHYRQGNVVVTRNWPGVEDTPDHSDLTVTSLPPHDETDVGPAPSISGSTSDSISGSDSGEAAAAAASPASAFCSLHGVTMRQRSKNGQTWYSHKIGGVWCRGEANGARASPSESKYLRTLVACKGCYNGVPPSWLCADCGLCGACCKCEEEGVVSGD